MKNIEQSKKYLRLALNNQMGLKGDLREYMSPKENYEEIDDNIGHMERALNELEAL